MARKFLDPNSIFQIEVGFEKYENLLGLGSRWKRGLTKSKFPSAT